MDLVEDFALRVVPFPSLPLFIRKGRGIGYTKKKKYSLCAEKRFHLLMWQDQSNRRNRAISEERLRELFLCGLDGDAAAYRKFLTELSGCLRAFYRRRMFQLSSEIEDLVQETLLAIHNKRHTYDRTSPLSAWIYTIARYKLIDLLRRRSSRERFTVSLEEAPEVLAETESDALEARQDLGKLLDKLPARMRLPIIHTKLEGLSVAEAAQLAGMSESAVKVGVHRGLKALAEMIRESHAHT